MGRAMADCWAPAEWRRDARDGFGSLGLILVAYNMGVGQNQVFFLLTKHATAGLDFAMV